MIVSDLITELKKFDPALEVKYVSGRGIPANFLKIKDTSSIDIVYLDLELEPVTKNVVVLF